GEHGALTRFALDRYVAAHHARELSRDRQAEASAAEALRGCLVGLAELVEQLGLLLRRHPNAGIGDRDLDPVAAVSQVACLKLDLAILRELAGIAQQVKQNLP